MDRKQTTSVMLLLLYALLITALLLLTVAGARLYAAALNARDAHAENRLALSYIQSQATGFSGDRVSVQPGPEGDMLVLREADGEYETRIFLYHGGLYSDFSPAESSLNPEGSQKICPLDSLSLQLDGGLLRIMAKNVEGYVYCSGGGANE